MKTFLFLLLPLLMQLLLPEAGQAQVLDPQVAARIDSVFSPWNTSRSPGMVVAVVQHGQVLYKRAFGMADVARREPLRPDHRFWVASVTKQFTAMAVALLAEQGKLHLEDDIRKFLPELPHLGDTVRVKHLIYHTSGLREGFTLIGMHFKGERHYTNAKVLEQLVRQQARNHQPGEQHAYNNGGYVLLAEIISRLSGRTYGAFLEQEIFQPLGMKDSQVYGGFRQPIPRLAKGYSVKHKGSAVTFRPGHFKGHTVGSSGLVTTLDDLIKWDQNFYHNRLGTGSQALIDLAMTPGSLSDGSSTAYAFGLEVEPHRGVLAVSHSGADPGYKAELVRFPEHGLSVICLSNAQNAYGLTAKLLQIGEWVLPQAFEAEANLSPPVSAPAFPDSGVTLRSDYPGYYLNLRNEADLRFVVAKEQKLYVAQSLGGYQGELEPDGPDRFREAGLHQYTLQFERAETVEVTGLQYRERANAFTLQKLEPVPLTREQLRAYAGHYYSPELGRHYRLSVRKGKLGLTLLGLLHFPLQPLEGNRFVMDLMGTNCLVFRKDSQGHVTGFGFNRDGIRNLAFQRVR